MFYILGLGFGPYKSPATIPYQVLIWYFGTYTAETFIDYNTHAAPRSVRACVVSYAAAAETDTRSHDHVCIETITEAGSDAWVGSWNRRNGRSIYLGRDDANRCSVLSTRSHPSWILSRVCWTHGGSHRECPDVPGDHPAPPGPVGTDQGADLAVVMLTTCQMCSGNADHVLGGYWDGVSSVHQNRTRGARVGRTVVTPPGRVVTCFRGEEPRVPLPSPRDMALPWEGGMGPLRRSF